MLNKTSAKIKHQINFFIPQLQYLYNWKISLQLIVTVSFLDS